MYFSNMQQLADFFELWTIPRSPRRDFVSAARNEKCALVPAASFASASGVHIDKL
jgi:hypothetical protein